MRKIVFSHLLFPLIDYFFYVGKQNKALYKYFGVSDKKLVYTPYSVDNKFFREQYIKTKASRESIKDSLNIPKNKRIILYSGKFIVQKQPLDLLKAFHKLNDLNVLLIFMGDGPLRPQLEDYINLHKLEGVYLTGFINQSDISKYYAIADLYIMCSVSDAWGLSTNEAMNFELPIILSDLVGCVDDLLEEGRNGYRFTAGDVDGLYQALYKLLSLNSVDVHEMGKKSAEIVSRFSYEATTENLKAAFIKDYSNKSNINFLNAF